MTKMAIIPEAHNKAEERREQQWPCNWPILQSTPTSWSFLGMRPVWAALETTPARELDLR